MSATYETRIGKAWEAASQGSRYNQCPAVMSPSEKMQKVIKHVQPSGHSWHSEKQKQNKRCNEKIDEEEAKATACGLIQPKMIRRKNQSGGFITMGNKPAQPDRHKREGSHNRQPT
jgi:hypothetical protein